MTTALIVLAHPNPDSFNAHWARASARAARQLGHEVLWSDLYAMGFYPAEAAERYGLPESTGFDPLKQQEQAAAHNALPPEIGAEVDKISRADRIVFHFPLWWFAPPAMLKGWCDRALVHGLIHDVDHRFDTGRCRGKAALLCVTTGASDAECGPDGKEGNWQMLVWPLAQTLRYCGFEVLEPVAAHGVHGYHEGTAETRLHRRLAGLLEHQQVLLEGWDSHPRLSFNSDDDFDTDGRLRTGAPSFTPFIRRT